MDNGNLPEGWSVKNIPEVITKISLTGRKLPQRKYLENGKYPVIDQGQNYIGGYTDDKDLIVPCKLPVIIFGDHTKAIKYVNFPFVAGADGVKVIQPSPDFLPKLFYYFLQAIKLPDKGYARHFQYLEKETIPLPPQTEQVRIVAKIEELFTQLDAGTAALRRIQTGLKRYKATVLQAAVEGRLLPSPIGRARGEGELPEGWRWVTVEEIGEREEQIVLTGPFGSNLGREDFIEAGIPLLTIGCLTEYGLNLEKAKYISEAKAKDLEKYRVRKGDLLFSRMATVGRAGLVTAQFDGTIFNYHLMRMRLDKKLIDAYYFLYYVRGSNTVTDYVKEVNHGATRDGINTEQLLNLPIALPSFFEQRRIVAEVERRLSFAQKVEGSVAASLARAARLRQAVLKSAFEGRL